MSAGGAERSVSLLVKGLQDDFDVHLLVLENIIEYELPDDQIVVTLDRGGASGNPTWNLLKVPLIAYKLKKYCRHHGISLVVSFLSRPNFAACLAKRFGVRAQVWISEQAYTPMWYDESQIRGKIGKLMISRLYPLADRILPNSAGTQLALEQHYKITNHYVVIKNPTDVSLIQQLQQEEVDDEQFDKFTFICVAGFRAQKNHRMLIDAFALLGDKNAQLLLIGKGALMEETRKQVNDLDMQDSVSFLGHKSNPFKYLSRADCLVLSSDFEGFPNVLLEAMACGLPIVSTDCRTGPRELLAPATDHTAHLKDKLEYGEFGILVPVRNAQMMADTMKKMIDDSGLRRRYKLAGLAKVEEFTREIVIEEFKQLIAGQLPVEL